MTEPLENQPAGAWLRDYALLALRLHRSAATHYGDDGLLAYFGPPQYARQVEQEPEVQPDQLVRDAQTLSEEGVGQGFDPARAVYVGKLAEALGTVARRLAGEAIPVREMARRCFDLQVDYIPEQTFAQAHALYDASLPGRGNVRRRLQAWREHHTLSPERRAALPTLVERALGEARRRTRALLPLPEGDEVTVEDLNDQPFRALAVYLGHFRSKVLINKELPFNVAELLYVVCHEAYPGHLAELCLKEATGHREHEVGFLLTPPYVISEGLALWAHRLAFPGDEAAQWLASQVYPEVGIEPDGSELSGVLRATDQLWGVRGNAALLLDDGHPERDVLHSLMEHALLDEPSAKRTVAGLRLPLREAYIFTYQSGLALLEPWLEGAGTGAGLEYLWTQPLLPSTLAGTRPISEPGTPLKSVGGEGGHEGGSG